MLLILIGCGDSDRSDVADAQATSTADARPTSLPASQYCESIAPFFCDFYLRCGRMIASSPEECHVNFMASCHSKYEAAYVELEAQGYMNLSPEGLALCKEHLDAVACDQHISELSGPCAQIWTGHQSVGESCALDAEYFVCDATSECVLGLDFCGTCRELVPLGGTCTPSDNTCGTDGFCSDNLCLARKRNGEACGDDDRCLIGSSCLAGQCVGPSFVTLGETCDRKHRCPYMSECIDDTCQAAVLIGAACDATTTCAAGYCDGVCKDPLATGASCSVGRQCQSGLCVDSKCQARPSACFQ